MTTNAYFTDFHVSPLEDQTLAEDLIIESIQIKGWDHYYLSRQLTNFDSFFGEDQASAFRSAHPVEMYLESTQSWEDNGSFLSKFGLEIRDSTKLVVSIKRFAEEITSRYPEITRPREGDIIAFSSPVDRRMRFFEISYVNNEAVHYAIGKLYTYTLTVRNFEYNGETFATGITELDAYQTINSIILDLILASGSGSYVIGETVSQITGFSGEVVAFVGNKLSLTKTKGELSDSNALLGDTSMTSRMLSVTAPGVHVDGVAVQPVNNDAMLNDNKHIDDFVINGIVNFSESNPFSE